MSQQPDFRDRATRVARPFVVRINADPSAAKPRWDIVTAKDISASGILFNYGQYLEPGSRVQFRISLPICGSVDCEGEVIRNVMGTSRGLANSGPAVCAVAAAFRNISESDRQALEDFLEKDGVSAAGQVQATEKTETAPPKIPRAKRLDRSFPTWIRKKGQTIWEPVAMKNISSSGILVCYPEPLEIGAGMGLRILLPFSKQPAMLWGTVARADRKGGAGSTLNIFDIGIRFTVIDQVLQQQLSEFAEQAGRD
jgi:hypothetical protein